MIVGAGLAGLITAHVFPTQRLIDSAPGPQQLHKALLRFRTPAVGDLVGLEFKPVTVQKAIWSDGEFTRPTVRTTNMYAKKVVGRVDDTRSITDTSTVTRYVAPDNFYDHMIESVGHRIDWGVEADFAGAEPIINTSPLPGVLASLGIETELVFNRAPITVARLKIVGCNAHQTVYFPDPDTTLYRASITGDIMIAEFMGEPSPFWTDLVCEVFGLYEQDYDLLGEVKQSYGKIAPLPTAARRELLHRLTTQYGIYSVGRFATYRNVLLDDVLHDALLVKRMINTDSYTRKLQGNPQ